MAEPTESATCKDFLQVRQEGNRDVRRALKHQRLTNPTGSDRPDYFDDAAGGAERNEILRHPISLG